MSIADKLNSLITARNNIRTALTGKGVSAAGSHGFEDFASDVDSIFIFDLADHVFKISLENGEYVRSYDYIGKTVTKLPDNKYDQRSDLISVNLPDTVTTIGQCAFRGCSNLEHINLENITEFQSKSLNDCRKLIEFNAPNLITIPSDVFFQGHIETYALKYIYLPKVTNIPAGCFRNLNYKGFPDLIYADIHSATVIGSSAFQEDWSLSEVNFCDNLESIGSYAFVDTNVTGELDFAFLTSIGEGAFENTKISKVKNLGSIASLPNAFGGCSKLTFLRIPDTVTSLSYTIVYGTYDSDVTVICEAMTPPTYGWQALGGATVVYVPDNSVDTYKAASGWSAIAWKIKPLSEYTGTD